MIRYHSNQIVNKGKKGKFTTKREVYHVVVNFIFLLAACRNFSYDQSFLPYNETGNEKGRTRNCGYTASMWRCQNLTAWSYVWNCPEVTFNIFASVCQRWSIFSLQEDHKDYLVNLEAVQVDHIRGICPQAIHPSQRCVIKPICTAVGKENVYTFADNCLNKIKNRSHNWTWKTSAKNLSGTVA